MPFNVLVGAHVSAVEESPEHARHRARLDTLIGRLTSTARKVRQ